jgi:hypothetical protein
VILHRPVGCIERPTIITEHPRSTSAGRYFVPLGWQRLVATVVALLSLLAPIAAADVNVPPGWFTGDLHAHWPDSGCWGVAPPQVMYDGMPADLNLVSVLLWGGGGFFEQNAADYFLGQQDNPVSTLNKIVHYDMEFSAFLLADRLGHVSYLNLADIHFPEVGYHGPIQEWARAQGAIIGSDHSQAWTSSYDEFPDIVWCCTPYEAPISIALGRVDFLDYQGDEQHQRDQWRFFWYSLLNCGFRPGLAATSDSWCLHNVGDYRTYARIEGELTYQKFLEAVAAGRTVAVEESDGFIHFKVNGLEVGEQLDVASGEPLTLEARVIFPDGAPRWGDLEFIRNGEVFATHSYVQIGGEFVVAEADTATRSSWYSVRTARSHAGAVFVEVDGYPVRPLARAAEYYMGYLDYLSVELESGFFYQLTPAELDSLQADLSRARQVYETIRDEANSQPVGIQSESPAPPTSYRVLGGWPNPFHRSLRIAIDATGGAAPVAVDIFGADGRAVRRLARRALGPGTANIIWDGTDDGGKLVPSGVYYYRVETGGRSIGGGRVVRVR